MLLHFYALGLILLAALPVAMMKQNLILFRRLPPAPDDAPRDGAPSLSVLIPARNEELSIGQCLRSVLEWRWPRLEVLVMDDDSGDATRSICEEIARLDRRVQVLAGHGPPSGWNGKQHACWKLAEASRGQWLLFLDADVRLTSDALPRLLEQVRSEPVDLLSGFPRQITESPSEQLMIPLMHFILLGYLPLARMRSQPGAEYAAGCGQLFLARREPYFACEGHKSIAASRHDGVQLPRAFRKQHFKTDIFDASDIATCRMYHNAGEVTVGLLKNATEGIGNWRTIVPFTILLGGAAVLPIVSLVLGLIYAWGPLVLAELAVATALSLAPRAMAARRFGQSWLGVVLHPLSVAAFLVLQWIALLSEACGYRVRWRGRR
ncbi:MAG: glycosyltransferase family 2 protein [Aureliella sp.]